MADTRTPDRVRDTINEVMYDSAMSGGIEAMMTRADELDSMLKAKLIGIATTPAARRHWDQRLDEWWKETTLPKEHPEIVVGSGLHAAIYCATRVAMGEPKPLVIEASDHPGGAFAFSTEPSFFVNSRNRPGELGIPGRDEALNFIPGAIVQPADLSSTEYQSNTEIAFCIRATLAMCARVIAGRKVRKFFSDNGVRAEGVTLDDETRIKAKRVIFAVGLGEPRRIGSSNILMSNGISENGRLMDYPTFLGRFDRPFPLRGMDRVAVLGSGDAGRTVVEALIGQSPSQAMSVASMDFPERIDWYGVNRDSCTREGWEKCNRSRYKGIARALPRAATPGEFPDVARIFPTTSKAETIEMATDGVYVDGAFYDAAIIAAGFISNVEGGNYYEVGNRRIARSMPYDDLFYIGPSSGIPSEERRNLNRKVVPENTVSIFRYADRTVTFAQAMPPNKTPVNMNVKINFSLDDDLLGEETKRVVRRKTRYYRKSQEGL